MRYSEGIDAFAASHKPAEFNIPSGEFIRGAEDEGLLVKYDPYDVPISRGREDRLSSLWPDRDDRVYLVSKGNNYKEKIFNFTGIRPKENDFFAQAYPTNPTVTYREESRDLRGVNYRASLGWGEGFYSEGDSEKPWIYDVLEKKFIGDKHQDRIVKIDYDEPAIELPVPEWVKVEPECAWIEKFMAFVSEAPLLIGGFIGQLETFIAEMPSEGLVELPIPDWVVGYADSFDPNDSGYEVVDLHSQETKVSEAIAVGQQYLNILGELVSLNTN